MSHPFFFSGLHEQFCGKVLQMTLPVLISSTVYSIERVSAKFIFLTLSDWAERERAKLVCDFNRDSDSVLERSRGSPGPGDAAVAAGCLRQWWGDIPYEVLRAWNGAPVGGADAW